MSRFSIAIDKELFEESSPCPNRIWKNCKVKIIGPIKYSQDFGFYSGTFEDTVFTVTGFINGRIELTAPGYGLLKPPGHYGNGKIYVSNSYIDKLKVIKSL
jgi:hypothetical protein